MAEVASTYMHGAVAIVVVGSLTRQSHYQVFWVCVTVLGGSFWGNKPSGEAQNGTLMVVRACADLLVSVNC